MSSMSSINRPEITTIREVAIRYVGRAKRIPVAIHSPLEAVAFMRRVVRDDAREHFLALYLDGRHRPIAHQVVSVGTATASLVHPREVFQPAVLAGAAAVIVGHNHPSGDPSPSCEDRDVTKRLARAAEVLGIRLLDSVVWVRSGPFVSLQERAAALRKEQLIAAQSGARVLPSAAFSRSLNEKRPSSTPAQRPFLHALSPPCTRSFGGRLAAKEHSPMPTSLLFVLIGVLGGIASGLFGVGGGVVIVPALIYWAGFSQHVATGTSLAVLLPPIGLAATIEYYRHDNVDVRAAIILAASMFVGAWIGAHFANQMKGPHLRLLFGVFISSLGIYLIYGASRRLGWV
jgi:uncharacterized protein